MNNLADSGNFGGHWLVFSGLQFIYTVMTCVGLGIDAVIGVELIHNSGGARAFVDVLVHDAHDRLTRRDCRRADVVGRCSGQGRIIRLVEEVGAANCDAGRCGRPRGAGCIRDGHRGSRCAYVLAGDAGVVTIVALFNDRGAVLRCRRRQSQSNWLHDCSRSIR